MGKQAAVKGTLFDGAAAAARQAPLAARMRPRTLDEIVGHAALLGQGRPLRQAIAGGNPGSLILWGPPGSGKTTLARAIAETLDVAFAPMSAVTAGVADLRRVVEEARNRLGLTGRRTVLFIDEIHRLAPTIEEVLYPAMEDFQLDIVVGKGPAASSIRLPLPPFTLVGATTRTGMITGPLRDRFGFIARLDYYEDDELESIVRRAAGILDVSVSVEGAWEIARRSRGTPRIANRLLRRVRDYAQVRGDGTINEQTARTGLAVFGVDERGLDKVDRAILTAICQQFRGGPVGLSTVAISVGEQTETVEDVYEPFLIQQGLLARTPRGRIAMPAAWAHIGLEMPIAGDRPLNLFS